MRVQLRRNPLTRWHQSVGGELHNSMVVSYPSDPGRTGLTDLSALPRIGFKGADTALWLRAQNLPLPPQANHALVDGDLLIARLSATEFLIAALRLEGAARITDLRARWSMDLNERTYLLERADSHGCFALTGVATSSVMAKLCAIDLRAHKFAPCQLAQTSVARSNAIVLRIDHGFEPQLLVFVDLSVAEYVWECLLDAMQEYAGTPVAYPDYLERIK